MEHHKNSKKKRTLTKSFYKNLYTIMGIVLVLLALYNISQISSLGSIFDKKLIEAKEATKPALIELAIITTNACEDCYDINTIIDLIKSTNVDITKKKEVDFNSREARPLIDKYGIEKVPTVIVTGEIDKATSLAIKFRDIGEEKQGAYVFTKLEPPFIETSTGKIRGKIFLTHLKKGDCEDCLDLKPLISQLGASGIVIEKQKEVDISSSEGKKLMDKYEIKNVPTIIMNQEADVYPTIKQSWGQIGSIEKDGSFVMRKISPPYYNVVEKKIKGLVSITFLADKECSNCYDAEDFHKPILQRMGVVLGDEKKLDISSSEGQSLIDKYEIEKVPTIILKGDIEEYPGLVRAWADVGTKESDGAYVFRKVEIAGKTYKDLSINKVIPPRTS